MLHTSRRHVHTHANYRKHTHALNTLTCVCVFGCRHGNSSRAGLEGLARARDLCTDATNYGLGATVTATVPPSSCLSPSLPLSLSVCLSLCVRLGLCVWFALCMRVYVCLHLRLHLNLFLVLNAAQKLCQMKFMRCARKTAVKTNTYVCCVFACVCGCRCARVFAPLSYATIGCTFPQFPHKFLNLRWL